VLVGPGGAGKGTVAQRLLEQDPRLWLSRSWTTRPRRAGEPAHAYEFVDRPTFEAHAAAGGFLEWTEFLGHLYGTPNPHPPAGRDLLLEIDLDGAEQVRRVRPDALVVLVLPPSPAVQRDRLLARGDGPEHVRRRLEKAPEEVRRAQALTAVEVVNDEVERAVAEVAAIVADARSAGTPPVQDPEPDLAHPSRPGGS
jgi:guanylate kinase